MWVYACAQCVWLSVTPWTTGLLCPWNFPGKNTRAGCHFLLQGIFPTQELNRSSRVSPALAGRFFTTVPPGKPNQSVSSVQSLSRVQLFAIPWTVARQASLSIISSQSLLKLMSIEWVMPSNRFIPCRPLLFLPSVFPNIRVFPNESVLCIRCLSCCEVNTSQSIGASASAFILPVNILGWFPLGSRHTSF